MFRIMNEYLSHLQLEAGDDLYQEMKAWLENDDTYQKSTITVSFNRYIVDLRMVDFSVDGAEKAFQVFADRFAFPYSRMTVRYNEGKRIRYRFASCRENKTGICMDVIFS